MTVVSQVAAPMRCDECGEVRHVQGPRGACSRVRDLVYTAFVSSVYVDRAVHSGITYVSDRDPS